VSVSSPRIVLFALTGFGNAVLKAICNAGRAPRYVVTRKDHGPYPYYSEESLSALAKRLAVPCLLDAEGEDAVATDPPDILLCATYHRILRPRTLQPVPAKVNLHPSLLPRYRGPNPFHWVIRNGERRTGVTAHMITEATDAGPIVWSEAIDIEPNETQGSLRFRLASVAARGAIATLRAIEDAAPAMPQAEEHATAFRRPADTDRFLSPDWTVEEADRRIRAFAPFPGVPIGTQIASEIVSRDAPSERPAGSVTPETEDCCRVHLADGDIVVRLSGRPRQ
jgi:methionyl-tRNA formyltransferase